MKEELKMNGFEESLSILKNGLQDDDDRLLKAQRWLNKKCRSEWTAPVVCMRDGCARFVAYIFKLERKNKPSVWYVLEMKNQKSTKLKRICVDDPRD